MGAVSDTSGVVVGALSAVVSHAVYGSSNFGSSVQVGEIISISTAAHTVSPSHSVLSSASRSIHIYGHGFSNDLSSMAVYFQFRHHKSIIVAEVASSDFGTSINATFRAALPLGSDSLSAVVSRYGVRSNPTTVGTMTAMPSIDPGSLTLDKSSSGNRIEIYGNNFGNDATEVRVLFSPADILATQIIECSDTVLVVDTSDSNSVTVNFLTALVQRSPFSVPGEYTTIALWGSQSQVTPIVSQQSALFRKGKFTLYGQHFGAAVGDVKVYLSTSSGALPTSVVAANYANLTVVISSLNLLLINTAQVVATVRGVKSSTVLLSDAYSPPRIKIHHGIMESPVEGGMPVTVLGQHLEKQSEIRCNWGSEQTRATHVAGNGTYLICNTAKQSPEISPLSVEFPDANLTLTPEIAVTYFTSILVSDLSSNAILTFRADVGTFIDTFVNPGSGGLNGPWGLAFGIDQNLYVASDGTSSVLRFDGSKGHFLDVFCEVASPRSLVFHLSDLYVCSSSTGMVLRFNGLTGSPRGIHTAATSFQQPWGIVFDSRTNESFVTSQNTNRIVSVAPNSEDSFSPSKSTIWSDTDIMSIAGLELTGEYVFASSPDAGSIVAGFNRTTGKYLSHFEDAALQRPFDLKAFNNAQEHSKTIKDLCTLSIQICNVRSYLYTKLI